MRTSASVRPVLAAWLAVAVILGASGGIARADGPLARLEGDKRVLLLFSKSRSDASVDRQLGSLGERRVEVEQRDIIVLGIAGDREASAAIGYVTLPAGAGRELRRLYEPRATGMTVILIGKDGLEKARWERFVAPQEVFDAIDALPSEESEARAPGQTG